MSCKKKISTYNFCGSVVFGVDSDKDVAVSFVLAHLIFALAFPSTNIMQQQTNIYFVLAHIVIT
jgi:hypothetical protein